MRPPPERAPESRHPRVPLDDRSCASIRELLSSVLDGEAALAERTRALGHLETCGACTALFEAEQEIRRALARRHRSGPRPRSTPLELAHWVRREHARRMRHSGLRRLAAAAALVALAWIGTSVILTGPAQELPCEEILVHLDVLEALEQQGIEPTAELLEILLETASNEAGPSTDPAFLDLDLFEFLLEEEILPESL